MTEHRNVEDMDLSRLAQLSRYIERIDRSDEGNWQSNTQSSQAQSFSPPGPGQCSSPLQVRGRGMAPLPKDTKVSSSSASEAALSEHWWALHQKRISAIVGEHWREFALRARAERHFHVRIAGKVWRVLRSEVQAARARNQRAGILKHRRLFILYRSCFRAWAQRARGAAEQMGKYLSVVRMRARRLYQRSFDSWVEFLCTESERSEELARLRTRRMLVRAVSAWRTALRVIWEKQEMASRAMHFWAGRRERASLLAWQGYLRERSWKAAAKEDAGRHCRGRLRAAALAAWREAAASSPLRREAAAAALRGVMAKVEEERARRGFDHWRRRAARSSLLGRRAESLRLKSAAVLRSRAFGWWSAWASRARALRAAAEALGLAAGRLLLRRALSAWGIAVLEAEEERGLEARSKVAWLLVLRMWREWARSRAERAEWRSDRVEAVHVLIRRRFFSRWRRAAGESLREREQEQEAIEWHQRNVGRWAVGVWRGEAKAAAAERSLEDEAFRHRAKALMGAALEAWLLALERRERKAAAFLWAAQRISLRPLRAWRAWAEVKAGRELARRAAVRFRYFKLLRAGLLGWEVAMQPNPSRMALWEELRWIVSVQVVRRIWVKWAAEFVPKQRSSRALACKAAKHWRLRLLFVSLQGWEVEAERLAAKRACRLRSDTHRRSRVLSRSIAAWLFWTRNKIVKEERRRLLVLETREVLDRAFLRRLFQDWLTLVKDASMQRFQDARAVDFLRRRSIFISWAAWRSFVDRCRWKASRVRNALCFSNER
mmetsp:Transcript_18470/g.44122  ORF Transcript_18470/g.44122 Transcript_18470/m.44122 type:complete len:777 (+) Transcript_18470:648-2978(+)